MITADSGFWPPKRVFCDIDRWEFAVQSIEPAEAIDGIYYQSTGTTLWYDGTQSVWLPPLSVTMTAGEVGHTCPMQVEPINPWEPYPGIIVGTNQTYQPWAVCGTFSNSASAPIPPF